jgi:hypothetical protein
MNTTYSKLKLPEKLRRIKLTIYKDANRIFII